MNSRYIIRMWARSLIVAVSACTVFAMKGFAQDDASWEELRATALARPRTFVYNTDGNDAHNWPSNLPVTVENFTGRRLVHALVPFIYLPFIFAADFFRSRLLGSAKATACLKLVSAILLAAVVAILAKPIVSQACA